MIFEEKGLLNQDEGWDKKEEKDAPGEETTEEETTEETEETPGEETTEEETTEETEEPAQETPIVE